MKLREILITTTLVLAMSAPARAVTLSSPPLIVLGNNELECYVANVGATNLPIQIQAVDEAGNVIETSGVVNFPPGTVAARVRVPATGYCRFIVQGPGSSVRATACAWNPTEGCTAAAPAQ